MIKYYQILSNITKYDQILQNIIKFMTKLIQFRIQTNNSFWRAEASLIRMKTQYLLSFQIPFVQNVFFSTESWKQIVVKIQLNVSFSSSGSSTRGKSLCPATDTSFSSGVDIILHYLFQIYLKDLSIILSIFCT